MLSFLHTMNYKTNRVSSLLCHAPPFISLKILRYKILMLKTEIFWIAIWQYNTSFHHEVRGKLLIIWPWATWDKRLHHCVHLFTTCYQINNLINRHSVGSYKLVHSLIHMKKGKLRMNFEKHVFAKIYMYNAFYFFFFSRFVIFLIIGFCEFN